jgi:Protein of unknown function (DUF2996)
MEIGLSNAAKFMTEANKSPKAAQKAKPAAAEEPLVPAIDTVAAPSTVTAEAKTVPPKKEKAPALEDKAFADFIQQDLAPAIQSGLTAQGWTDLDLQFTKLPVSISGLAGIPDCWQIVGKGQKGQRQFNLYFFDESIQGKRGFSCTSNTGRTSSIESFLIDERKITLDLLIFGLMKRLNAQQWLLSNPITVVS